MIWQLLKTIPSLNIVPAGLHKKPHYLVYDVCGGHGPILMSSLADRHMDRQHVSHTIFGSVFTNKKNAYTIEVPVSQ
jgi:hypothetical protein